MKHYNPKNLKPSINEFYKFTQDKLSEPCKQTVAYKVTLSLFQTAQRLYRTLDNMTSDRLAVFVDKQTYLTLLQEHDLTALTAMYLGQLDMPMAREIVKQAQGISDSEREILLAAIDLYQTSVASTCAALGNPRWVEA